MGQLPPWAAEWSMVMPASSTEVVLQPALSSIWKVLAWPRSAAHCSADAPRSSVLSVMQPDRSSCPTICNTTLTGFNHTAKEFL